MAPTTAGVNAGASMHLTGKFKRRRQPASAAAFHALGINRRFLEPIRVYIEQHGKPQTYFSDKANVFGVSYQTVLLTA